MNFVQQLMSAPVMPKPRRAYNKVESKLTPQRIRLHLEGEELTLKELAALTGKTYPAVQDFIKRLNVKGVVRICGSRPAEGVGGRASWLYTWVGEKDAE